MQAKEICLQINGKRRINGLLPLQTIMINTLLKYRVKRWQISNILDHGLVAAKKDFDIKKAPPWQVCHKMEKSWNSSSIRKSKYEHFK